MSLAYEAMTGLGLLATPSQVPFTLSGRVPGVRVVILGAGLAGMTVAYERKPAAPSPGSAFVSGRHARISTATWPSS